MTEYSHLDKEEESILIKKFLLKKFGEEFLEAIQYNGCIYCSVEKEWVIKE